jgi:hypothetical protein
MNCTFHGFVTGVPCLVNAWDFAVVTVNQAVWQGGAG